MGRARPAVQHDERRGHRGASSPVTRYQVPSPSRSAYPSMDGDASSAGPQAPYWGLVARRDIENREDCERLVRAFYGRALDDPIIGWLFTDVAKLDLEAHVPQIASFWETILLGAQSYGGGAFRPHAALH